MDEGFAILVWIVSVVISFVVLVSFLNLCRRVRLLLDRTINLEAHAVDQTRYLAAMSANLAKFVGDKK